MHAIQLNAQQKIDGDTLKNGVSYFSGPLLNWTLVGVIKCLVRDVQTRGSDGVFLFSEFGLISILGFLIPGRFWISSRRCFRLVRVQSR